MGKHTSRMALAVVMAGLAAGCCCPRKMDPATVGQAAPAGRQIFVDLTTVRIPEGQVTNAMGDLRLTASGDPRALTKAEAEALWERWRTNRAVETVQAPKLLTLEDQEGTVFIGETIRFARTEAVTNRNGGLEFSIEDGPVFVGYQLRVVAAVSEDGERIALDLHTQQRRMRDGYSQASIAAMDQATFLRDVVLEERLDAELEILDGGHVLLGSSRLLDGPQGRYVGVTVVSAVLLEGREARATRIEPPRP